MLSYLHGFHAGNHADILKHIVLNYTAEYYSKKDKPYTVFDTHSGSGLYDLSDERAVKTGEASRGILRLQDYLKNPEKYSSFCTAPFPAELKHFTESKILNLTELLSFYPGSPLIEAKNSMEGCNLFFTELHKAEYESLKKALSGTFPGKVFVENTDGFSFLKKNTPPAIKRGYILCDPSYEEKSDYINAAEILAAVHKKWSGAGILLWYPLLQNKLEYIENMKQFLLAAVKNKNQNAEVLDAELCIDKEDSHVEVSLQESIGSAKPRLYGSGMFVINPCWGLKYYLEATLPFLSELLSADGNGSWKLNFY